MYIKMPILLLLCFYVTYSIAISPCGQSQNCSIGNSYSLGYYWGDYFGTIPCDAFPGGYDGNGEETFIGQVYFKQFELLPGTIFRGCPIIRTSAHLNELTSNKYIKILCTNMAHKLKWKQTKARELYKLAGCHFVLGGSEVGLTVYIGRTLFMGQQIIGKVFPDSASNAGLWIPESTTKFTEFEILTYGC